MDALETMRKFVKEFPDFNILDNLYIDYTDKVPNCAGLFPNGLVEISRTPDILGNVTVENQYNFALYTVLTKDPGEDEGATDNASWQMSFQEWVQEQSIKGKAPTFGDDPRAESIIAQNGELYAIEESGTAMYVIRISARFSKRYEGNSDV